MEGRTQRTSTVRSDVDGEDISDLRLFQYLWCTQITRSTKATPLDAVRGCEKRVYAAQHASSARNDNAAAGGTPRRARQWDTGSCVGIGNAGRVANEAGDDTWQNEWCVVSYETNGPFSVPSFLQHSKTPAARVPRARDEPNIASASNQCSCRVYSGPQDLSVVPTTASTRECQQWATNALSKVLKTGWRCSLSQ